MKILMLFCSMFFTFEAYAKCLKACPSLKQLAPDLKPSASRFPASIDQPEPRHQIITAIIRLLLDIR